MMQPSFITTMRSASAMVESLCATTRHVRPERSRPMASETCFSVLLSSALVASSMMRIGALRRNALAIEMRCF